MFLLFSVAGLFDMFAQKSREPSMYDIINGNWTVATESSNPDAGESTFGLNFVPVDGKLVGTVVPEEVTEEDEQHIAIEFDPESNTTLTAFSFVNDNEPETLAKVSYALGGDQICSTMGKIDGTSEMFSAVVVSSTRVEITVFNPETSTVTLYRMAKVVPPQPKPNMLLQFAPAIMMLVMNLMRQQPQPGQGQQAQAEQGDAHQKTE